MTEPDFTSPEYIKKQFYHLAWGGDFDRMGPWLIYILKNRSEIDIPVKRLREAFEYVVIYRLNDGKVEEALQYMARSFSLGDISSSQRRKMLDTLFDYISEEEEQLVKADWSDLKKFLTRQIKYLQVYGGNDQLINQLISVHEKIDHKMKFASEIEESPMREFIQGFTNLFYSHLPTEEAADYASQIILESQK